MEQAHGSSGGASSVKDGNMRAIEGQCTNFGLMMFSQRMREVATAGKKGASSAKLVQMSFKVGCEPDLVPLLSESISGRALSLICVCVSAAPANRSQSRNALEFGQVFSCLKVQPQTVPEVQISTLRDKARKLAAAGEVKGGANPRYALAREAQGRAGQKLGELLTTLMGSSGSRVLK